MTHWSLPLWLTLAAASSPAALGQDGTTERLAALEMELHAAQARVAELEGTLATLAAQVAALRSAATPADAPAVSPPPGTGEPTAFAERMTVPTLGADEREHTLTSRPELFLQTAYFANPIDGATPEDVTRNFAINRMELRWAGRMNERLGMGYELQYHPANDGHAEELINDAYLEYYASDVVTIRAGQFVKPFGFDVQHSTSARESPERGIFAGYFFPGQRDRGVMVRANLGNRRGWLRGTTLSAGLFNGNRFFADNNGTANVDLRLRKIFPSGRLALGASLQSGTQVLPPTATGKNAEDVYGVDAQFAVGRLGIRVEYVQGNTPSTLLALEPEFTPNFVPGERSSGTVAFFDYEIGARSDLYWRSDRFRNDPVTGADVRAFNLGYLLRLTPSSRLTFDYQWKNEVTYNDDELNTGFSIRWDALY